MCWIRPPLYAGSFVEIYYAMVLGSFVFLLGIPGLVFQLVIDESTQTVIRRNGFGFGRTLKTLALWHMIVLFVLTWVIDVATTPRRPVLSDWIAAILVSLTLVAGVAFWWYQLDALHKSNIITRLQYAIENGTVLSKHGSDELVADLIVIGKNCQSGREKAVALESIASISHSILRKATYDGTLLDPLLEGIEEILLRGPIHGKDTDIICASKLISSIQLQLGRQGLGASSDYARTIRTLGRIGTETMTRLRGETIVSILETCHLDERRLFQIGVAGIKSDQPLVARASLANLQARVVEDGVLAGSDASAYFIGLLSHYWGLGEFAQDQVRRDLKQFANSVSPSFESSKTSTMDHFAQLGDYDTAALVAELPRSLKSH